MSKSWESSPWKWIAVVVIATVVGGVTTAAVQKWWGLKLAEKTALAQAQKNPILGRYRAVY